MSAYNVLLLTHWFGLTKLNQASFLCKGPWPLICLQNAEHPSKWLILRNGQPQKKISCANTLIMPSAYSVPSPYSHTKFLVALFTAPYFFKGFIYLFLERGEGREKNINVCLPLMWPPLGIWPATQACALIGNWTADPLVCSPHSIHWATPARAPSLFVKNNFFSVWFWDICRFCG